MHGDKLLKVADMLERLPELVAALPDPIRHFQFTMGQWLHTNEIWEEGDKAVCGTIGSAAGWAVRLLPELGLSMRHGAPAFTPPGQGWHESDYSALAKCFDIPVFHARRLFGFENVNDRLAVAKNIRKYVESPPPADQLPPFAVATPDKE